MSTSLFWKPAPKNEPEPETLDYQLKAALSRRLWGMGDGSVWADEITVGEELIPYLNGLIDGGIEGAQELLDAIHKHGQVILWIAS
jgi:hypothetical protein